MSANVKRVQVLGTLRRSTRRLTHHLDTAVWNQNAARRLKIVGWAVHKTKRLSRVRLMRGNDTLGTSALDIARPRVKTRFAGYPNAGRAGFEINISSPGPGAYSLILETESGKQISLSHLTLEARQQPRVYLMHIPKTAGTSLNNWFCSHFGEGKFLVHLESESRWRSNPEKFTEYEFLSGHVNLERFAAKMNLAQYYVAAVLRDPWKHFLSHLAWIRRLADPGEEARFAQHIEYTRELASRLGEADLSDAGSLGGILSTLSEPQFRLLDNCQTRYFVHVHPGHPVTEDILERALNNQSMIHRIGTTDDLDAFIAGVCEDMRWPKGGPIAKKNVSVNYYGLHADTSEMRAVLEPFVRYDLQLLAHLRQSP